MPGMARLLPPAFAEYRYSSDEVRDEPAFEQVFGDVPVVLDLATDRSSFSDEEAADLSALMDAPLSRT